MQKSTFRKNTFDLSPEIHQMAKKEELGELCKVYPVSRKYNNIYATGVCCILFGVLMALFGLALVHDTFIAHLVFAVLAFILLSIGFYTIFSKRIYDRWQIYVWQYGFIYEKKQIRQAFRWNQIESVQASLGVTNKVPPVVYTCKVRRRDGYEVTLDVFSDLPELIDVVLEESAHQLSLQELNILPAKSIKTFTAFKLDQKGLVTSKRRSPGKKYGILRQIT